MEMFTGEVMKKVELDKEDQDSLKRFFDKAINELNINEHETVMLSSEKNLYYAKSGLGHDDCPIFHNEEDFYWTNAHILIKDGEIAAACLMTDFYEDLLTGSSYDFDLNKWINSVDVDDNKRKIYCYDGNVGIGFDNVMIDNNGEVELCLNAVHVKEYGQTQKTEPKADCAQRNHLEMLRITKDLMSHMDWPRKKGQIEI